MAEDPEGDVRGEEFGLLILSINVRLMGIVSRLRQYIHAKHDAAKNNRVQEAEAYTAQIALIEQRGEMIRRCFLLVLISLAGTNRRWRRFV